MENNNQNRKHKDKKRDIKAINRDRSTNLIERYLKQLLSNNTNIIRKFIDYAKKLRKRVYRNTSREDIKTIN